MGLLDTGLLGRARALVSSMNSKLTVALNKQGADLKKARTELQQALKRLEDSETQVRTLQEENDTLKLKIHEIRKTWDTFQSIASDASKIQKLITAFKRLKKELLELRREYDLNKNTLEELTRENTRYKGMLQNSSKDGKVDFNAIMDQIAGLKKENSSLKTKSDQQDRLIKSLKEKEEKLVASMKRHK